MALFAERDSRFCGNDGGWWMSRKFSEARRKAFLTALAACGNITLAAERVAVSRSWVGLQRATDAGFDAACRDAIAVAKESLCSPPLPAQPRSGG